MKRMLNNFALFVVLAVLFSGLTGCGGSKGTSNETASNVVGNANTPAGEPKKSEYPPLASAVAQSDMKNLDGSTSKVADRKGKVLLLNMWATWCGPCRGEMPELVKMQDEHRDKGFEIIGLNTDDGDTKEMVEEFAAEMKLNYTLVWADTAMQNGLLKISNFNGIPQSFVVDRDGNLRGVFRGGGKNEVKKMEELVAKVVAE
ncbi:MAG: TlpA disulfide reductase family protein [bacterium]|nr:TlpA disulfide reductase family protein [bacterium]